MWYFEQRWARGEEIRESPRLALLVTIILAPETRHERGEANYDSTPETRGERFHFTSSTRRGERVTNIWSKYSPRSPRLADLCGTQNSDRETGALLVLP
jgi:hypothetical protein